MDARPPFDPDRSQRFRYEGFDLDAGSRTLTCRYALDGLRFEERITFPGGGAWADPAVERAARLVFLLAGVSYYKAGAPPVVDLGDHAVSPLEAGFLRSVYVDGLGEFAHRNGLDLSGIRFAGDLAAVPAAVTVPTAPDRPLVPFGGGIDSIVSAEVVVRRFPDTALFVMNRPGDRFAAIEDAAAVTQLPIVRAERQLDPQVLRSRELGFRNGHVPITGILSAVAVMAAVLDGRGTVVMSNEWSASSGNVEVDGVVVNHQWSKGLEFEAAFRGVLAESFGDGIDWFSLLRPWSELRIAERFATLDRFLPAFRSCNRAFHQDPAARADRWCGRCDKCAFIDLILAPFVPAAELAAIFGGAEPLRQPDLLGAFRALCDLSDGGKPWECVGDALECRAAVVLAAARADRLDATLDPVLHALVAELGPAAATASAAVPGLLAPIGPHHVPPSLSSDSLLV
jgi:UDP-N-acetyl-alpha-D-muramoyl-L-alanyl-L-glutamate epimerase